MPQVLAEHLLCQFLWEEDLEFEHLESLLHGGSTSHHLIPILDQAIWPQQMEAVVEQVVFQLDEVLAKHCSELEVGRPDRGKAENLLNCCQRM